MIINLLDFDKLPNINYNNHKVYQCRLQSPQKKIQIEQEKKITLGR